MIKENSIGHVFLQIMKDNGLGGLEDIRAIKNIIIKLKQYQHLYSYTILGTKIISFEIEYLDGRKYNIDFKGIKKLQKILWAHELEIEKLLGFDIYFILSSKSCMNKIFKYRIMRQLFWFLLIYKKEWKWVFTNNKNKLKAPR